MNSKYEKSLALARKRAEEKKEQLLASSNFSTPNDIEPVDTEWQALAPEVDSSDQEKVEAIEDENLFIRSLNIRDVYTKLTGVNPGQESRHESIMVRCVSPSHPDENPSAWLNDRGGFYNCATCEYHTGIVGMIAASLGYNPNKGQLRGEEFSEAKDKLFKMFNFKSAKQLREEIIASKFKDDAAPTSPSSPLAKSSSSEEPAPEKPAKPETTEPKLSLVQNLAPPSLDSTDDPDDDDENKLPELNNILETLPENSFLSEYIKAGSTSRAPDEYFLAGGIQMVAAALGPMVRGKFGGEFKLSTSVLRVGPTGNYKSMTDAAGFNILSSGNFQWDPQYTKGDEYAVPHGVRIIGNIGSGEYYLEQLSKVMIDKEVRPIRDVTCWIINDEFSGFITRAEAKGNTTKELFMHDEARSGLNDWISTGSVSRGTLKAINPLRLFSSSIQTEALRDVVQDRNVDNGFLSRMCIFGGNRKSGIKARHNTVGDLTSSKQKLEEIRRVFWTIRQSAKSATDPDPRQIWEMYFTDDAADRFERREIGLDSLKDQNGMLSRMDLHFKRLCVIMAANNLHEQVEIEDVELAWWVTEYLIRTADVLLGKMRSTEMSNIEETILKKLKNIYNRPVKGRNYMVLSSIKNACDARNVKGWKDTDYLKALENLVDAEKILVTEATARNLPQKRYMYRDPNAENQDLGTGQKVVGPTRTGTRTRSRTNYNSKQKKGGE